MPSYLNQIKQSVFFHDLPSPLESGCHPFSNCLSGFPSSGPLLQRLYLPALLHCTKHEPFAWNILPQIDIFFFSAFKPLLKCYLSERPSLPTLNQIEPFLLHCSSWHSSTLEISLHTHLYISIITYIYEYMDTNGHILRAHSLFALPYYWLLGSGK